MVDELTDRLAGLAPGVDTPAARAAFDRTRARRRRTRRLVAGGATALLLVAAGTGLAALADGEDDGAVDLATGGDGVATSDGGGGLEAAAGSVVGDVVGDPLAPAVLAVEPTGLPLGDLAAATTADQLDALWAPLATERPAVDLDDVVVLRFTVPAGGCGVELTGIERRRGTPAGHGELPHLDLLTPQLAEPTPEQLCPLPLLHTTFVVALPRTTVSDPFTVRLLGDDRYGTVDERFDVPVGHTAAEAAAYAELLRSLTPRDGTTTTTAARAAVPDVRGRHLTEATEALGAAGFALAVADGDPDATQPSTDGTAADEPVVVAQEPPPGELVEPGAVVGVRTALVSPSICAPLAPLVPAAVDGDALDLAAAAGFADALAAVAPVAHAPLRGDAEVVGAALAAGDDLAAAAGFVERALDRIAIHVRACG